MAQNSGFSGLPGGSLCHARQAEIKFSGGVAEAGMSAIDELHLSRASDWQ
jgi:hypothetical protein